ncbi:NupC/NupG family nucleoside CNT transporter [bacterium]|jgi:CNT family concentrative nucleoside transporter|nr:NupC/NupG family nucleoside CNT transporter [bacterium]MDG1223225.1 nucleoside transporter C-terminal domain-containing protein [Candidatus Neomarinimicrobiota bacterium]MDG1847411.1 nucleoside transporter C-terminal domain-containing protein [Candidatus Neomarinimicrobiota bacterium]
MQEYTGILGVLVLLGISYMLSNNKSLINKNIIFWGLGLQFSFAVIILKTSFGKALFFYFNIFIVKVISFADAGSDFLFTSFIPGVGYDQALINFAFRALPVIIFFSSLIAVSYHLGIIQFVIKKIAFVMEKTMKTSGAETLSISANIFVGQTEAPILIRPYISTMTKSELMAVMVGGFATVAGSVMALYVTWLSNIPNIAGHLLAASVMSAPAALMVAKIIYPETKSPRTIDSAEIILDSSDNNLMDAIGRGATDGMKLAANVAAMLIAFISMVAMINFILGLLGTSMQDVLGLLFKPLAWTMGVPWKDAGIVGTLMGEKIVLTELIAFGDLSDYVNKNTLSERSTIIASYALCGFANFGSIGIQLGGIGSMAPDRKNDLSKLVIKAMLGGAIASWLTASIVGIII